MVAVSIRDLKGQLWVYLRLAAAGERVLVTDQDQVIAELRAPAPERPATTVRTDPARPERSSAPLRPARRKAARLAAGKQAPNKSDP